MQNQAIRSMPAQARPTLTIFLWLLIGFLAVDAVIRVTGMVVRVDSLRELSNATLRRGFEAVLFATLDVLLILQILLRTFAARIFGSLLFLFHIAFVILQYVVREPDAWLRHDTLGRLQVLGQVVFCALALVLLNRDPARTVLRS